MAAYLFLLVVFSGCAKQEKIKWADTNTLLCWRLAEKIRFLGLIPYVPEGKGFLKNLCRKEWWENAISSASKQDIEAREVAQDTFLLRDFSSYAAELATTLCNQKPDSVFSFFKCYCTDKAVMLIILPGSNNRLDINYSETHAAYILRRIWRSPSRPLHIFIPQSVKDDQIIVMPVGW